MAAVVTCMARTTPSAMATATSTKAAVCWRGGEATQQMYHVIESLQAFLFRAVCDGGESPHVKMKL
jgi:hypothetical protein